MAVRSIALDQVAQAAPSGELPPYVTEVFDPRTIVVSKMDFDRSVFEREPATFTATARRSNNG
ncbi:hypothetical protein MOV08_10090 [Streptomyces yunnanensis]|uniref:UTRA domain-containing protein n=1 Tax=Streptomyces yunnanensis TaxID=156453 RepID=A0ABY8A4C6_9ACTN|nr:hypothetical protein [Streptomyces yunnanensis]WEB39586.1 hypothetical protein MOV08_10090 [Streptomyces yunnanensis]